MKFTTSRRVMPWRCRKYTAWESFSPKMATSTLAPVTSFLPEDCTCRMARWITRWKPSVGWVSISSLPATVGVCSVMKAIRLLAQLFDVGGAGAQDLGGRGVVEQRQQQVLHGDELVALLPCLDKGHVQADFQFLRNHLSFLHYACQRVLVLAGVAVTCSTLVAATSTRKDAADAPTPPCAL
jgi:hypothetical protein